MLKRLAPGILLSFPAPGVLAAPIDPAGFLGEFFNKASRLTDQLIGVSTELYRFSELEWTTFAVFALVIVLIKWTIGSAAVADVIFVVLMILIAQSLMQSYDYVLAVLWEITTVLSDDINLNAYRALDLEASGIKSTGVFLLDMINHIMERITFEPVHGNSGFFSMFTNIAISIRDTIFLVIFFIVLFRRLLDHFGRRSVEPAARQSVGPAVYSIPYFQTRKLVFRQLAELHAGFRSLFHCCASQHCLYHPGHYRTV